MAAIWTALGQSDAPAQVVRRTPAGLLGIVGYATTFDRIIDNGAGVRDVFLPGAFHVTLTAAEARRIEQSRRYLWPLILRHQTDNGALVGAILDASEDAHGLLIRAEMQRETPAGKAAAMAVGLGQFWGFSIGYVVEQSYRQHAIRIVERARLLEVTLTDRPANPDACITDIERDNP